MPKLSDEDLIRMAKEIPRGSVLCSPVYRCFPPRPTICLICGSESSEDCPLEAKKKGGVMAYPRDDGDFTVIGPECFAMKDGSVLSWRGTNYTPQKATLRVRIHNLVVRFLNKRSAARNGD